METIPVNQKPFLAVVASVALVVLSYGNRADAQGESGFGILDRSYHLIVHNDCPGPVTFRCRLEQPTVQPGNWTIVGGGTTPEILAVEFMTHFGLRVAKIPMDGKHDKHAFFSFGNPNNPAELTLSW